MATITKRELRQVIAEALDDRPNPLIDDVADDDLSKLINGLSNNDREETKNVLTKLSKKVDDHDGTNAAEVTEALLRTEIRKILVAESSQSTHVEFDDEEKPTQPKKWDADDDDVTDYKTIANDLDISASGGHRLMVTTLHKFEALSKLDDEGEGKFGAKLISWVGEYIDMLASTNELTDEDIRDLKNHPNILAMSDEFREFIAPRVQAFADSYLGHNAYAYKDDPKYAHRRKFM